MTTATKVRAPSRQICTDHCSNCDGHFHGLGAYDKHRTGSLRDGTDRCMIGLELERATTASGRPLLQVWTHEGHCELNFRRGKAVPLHPITIWQAYGADQVGDRLRAG